MGPARLRLLVLVVAAASSASVVRRRLVSRTDGDILLGALFPVHARGASPEVCGPLQADDGIQPLEALLFTLDQINNDSQLLPGLKLGVVAHDSCDNIVHALDECLDFVTGSVENRLVAKIDSSPNLLCSHGEPINLSNVTDHPVVGVIGDQRSDITVEVSSLLRIFKIPQISYASTSPTLSNRERFSYFFRTVPSDVWQSYAILEILRNFNWTYASLVYSASEYGTKGYEKLTANAPDYGVCFASTVRIDHDQFNASGYDRVVRELMKPTMARIVVVFTDKEVASHLIAATRRYLQTASKVEKPPIWVGSDGWSNREIVTSGQETTVEGAITVQPLVRPLDGFDEYFAGLKPTKNGRNPWFNEYWQEKFKCKLKKEQLPEGIPSTNYTEECKRDLHIKNPVEMKYLHFVRDAVYAFAHALHNLHREMCPDAPGRVCDAMRDSDGSVLKFYLEKANFEDQDKKVFKFHGGGDGPPRYSVLNYQKEDDDAYAWKDIGTFSLGLDEMPVLNIDRRLMQYRRYERKYPNSTCKEQCDPKKGLVPHAQSNSSCCPTCKHCKWFEWVHNGECVACAEGQRPGENRAVNCTWIAEQVISFLNPWAAATMAFASLGILLTLAVACVFWRHRHTPVIKAAGRELSAVLLVAIFLSFAKTFVILSKPTEATCAANRFSLGLTPTLSFAAIAVKTNRIARIFGQKAGGASGACPRARYTSPASQLAITCLLTLVEIVINTSWLLYQPAKTSHVFPNRESRVLICEGMDDYSFLVGLVYPCVLVGFCTVYAFQTRKCPGGFNEARYIAFTTYTTCVLWLSFVPLFLTASSPIIRVVTLAASFSIGGMVQLCCLFVPKVYVVLCKPEKNTREGVMAQHRSSSYALATPPVLAVNSVQTQSSTNGSQIRHVAALEQAHKPPTPTSPPTQQPPCEPPQQLRQQRSASYGESARLGGILLEDPASSLSTSKRSSKGNSVHFLDPEPADDPTDLSSSISTAHSAL